MANKTVTLTIPDTLYDRYQARAQHARRSVEEELLDALATALPSDDLPADIAQEVASLAALDDEALWQAARARLTDEEVARSEGLHHKRQREGLTDAEAQAAADLAHTYDRLMLVRAQAALLLKQRGHDTHALVSPP